MKERRGVGQRQVVTGEESEEVRLLYRECLDLLDSQSSARRSRPDSVDWSFACTLPKVVPEHPGNESWIPESFVSKSLRLDLWL